MWLLDDVGCRALFTTVPAVALIALLAAAGIPVYRDASIVALTANVPSGAFAGLQTSSHRLAFITKLDEDVAGLGPRCTILFFDDFPAGYLMTRATPNTNSVWVGTDTNNSVGSYRRALLHYYAREGLPDVAVELHRVPGDAPSVEQYLPNDPLVSMINRRYVRVVSRRDYAVFTLDSSTRCHIAQ